MLKTASPRLRNTELPQRFTRGFPKIRVPFLGSPDIIVYWVYIGVLYLGKLPHDTVSPRLYVAHAKHEPQILSAEH